MRLDQEPLGDFILCGKEDKHSFCYNDFLEKFIASQGFEQNKCSVAWKHIILHM